MLPLIEALLFPTERLRGTTGANEKFIVAFRRYEHRSAALGHLDPTNFFSVVFEESGNGLGDHMFKFLINGILPQIEAEGRLKLGELRFTGQNHFLQDFVLRFIVLQFDSGFQFLENARSSTFQENLLIV